MAKKLTDKEQSGLDYLDSLVSIEYLNVRKDKKAESATINFEGFADLNDIADTIAAHDAEVLQRAMAMIAKDTVRKGVFES